MAEAQACWSRYAASGHDPDFERARGQLQIALQAQRADRGPIELSLAQVAFLRRDYSLVINHAEKAAAGCLRSRDDECELQARRFSSFALNALGQLDAAIWASEKGFALARSLGRPADQYKAASALARHRIAGMNNLPRAASVLDQSAAAAALLPRRDQIFFLHSQARIRHHLGYFQQAAVLSRRLQALARDEGDMDLYLAAGINYAWQRYQSGGLTQWQRSSLLENLNELMAEPRIAPEEQLSALQLKARLVPDSMSAEVLQRCVALAREASLPYREALCAARLSALFAATDPAKARHWLHQARQAADRTDPLYAAVAVAAAEIAILWSESIEPEVVERSVAGLDAIARLRASQAGGNRTAEFLSGLTDDYYALADRIAAAVERGHLPGDHLASAVAVVEAARATASVMRTRSRPMAPILNQWLHERAGVSRQADLEWPQFYSRFRAIESAPAEDMNPAPAASAVNVELVRRMIQGDEPVLYFQWPLNPGLDRRAYVLGDGKIDSLRLAHEPGRAAAAMDRFAATLPSTGQPAETALEALYQQLLAPVAELLPANFKAPTLIPDGELYALPFAAMGQFDRRLAGSQVYPSLKLSAIRRSPRPRRLTVFADPARPLDPPSVAASRSPLPALPATRQEASAIAAAAPSAAVFIGQQATETRARETLTTGSGIVHFASHALLDNDEPLQSSLQLAPAFDADGWLTLAEVQGLTLRADLVVLSACEAASGRRLTGEGLLGFSQTLLQSGAAAVLANLWPIDDQYAAIAMQRLYARLAQGQTLNMALNDTISDLRGAGYPAAAWAGWTLVGAGSLALHPDLRPTERRPWLQGFLLAVLAAAATAGLLALWGRSR